MRIHIGKEIRLILKQKGITGAWLADRVKTSKRNLYALLDRAEISTKQLEDISRALEVDLFRIYADKALADLPDSENPSVPDYQIKKRILVMVELDGDQASLRESISKLNAINEIL